jgi:hypothetical protein
MKDIRTEIKDVKKDANTGANEQSMNHKDEVIKRLRE